MDQPATAPATAIVTGGGKRVGAAIVAALLADGWCVVAHVHHDGDSVPDGAIKVVADLGEADCAARIFDCCDDLPPVRLLVNNAARFVSDGSGSASAAEFDAHMAVNARAPMLLIVELARRKGAVAAKNGEDALVVNITDAKLAAPNADFLSYTLSKFALAGLTEVAARALAANGIRVNAIAPALMLPSGEQGDANFAAVHAHNPLHYAIAPEDVVTALRFLIDSLGVTGQTLTIDGGQRFWSLPRDVQYLGDVQYLEPK